MKKFLLFASLVLGVSNSFAQLTCATATTLTANGDYTAPAITTGTYKVACFNAVAGINSVWYKFTAPSNGEISISTNLPTNDGGTNSNDTRISIATGLCTGTLTCVQGNDDVDDVNYLSELLNVPVTAGTTYLIQFDDRWSTKPADFTFEFVAVSCARPTVFYLPEYADTSSADLYWNQTTVAPSGYEVDWSTDFAAAEGTGTSVTVPAGALPYSTATISGLPASSNFRYFVRADCGTSQSGWSGPYYGYLPVALPYSNDFEDVAENNFDGFINFTLFNAGPTSDPADYADGGAGYAIYTPNSTTTVSDLRGYFRGVNLVFGEEVTVSFKTRLYTTSTTDPASPMNFDLTVGDSQSAAGQTTVVDSFINDTDAEYTTHTATYTAAADGIHYFGIHNNSDPGAVQTFLFLDTIELTTNLSNNEVVANSFNVSPNPASSLVTISNTTDALINSASIVDMNGRVVKNLKVANVTETQINVSDLAKGVYMINVSSDKGNVTKKLVIK